jgi:hypothetical protein
MRALYFQACRASAYILCANGECHLVIEVYIVVSVHLALNWFRTARAEQVAS